MTELRLQDKVCDCMQMHDFLTQNSLYYVTWLIYYQMDGYSSDREIIHKAV
jgi:hypothetical protein